MNPRNIGSHMFPTNKSWNKKIEFLLNYGVLAPSTHNSQPWLFKIVDNVVFVISNPNLKLPEADSKSRDMYISLGACVENIHIAATEFNLEVNSSHDLVDGQPAVKLALREHSNSTLSEDSSLFEQIDKRQNSRGIFSPVRIPERMENEILAAVSRNENLHLSILKKKKGIEKVATLTGKGIRVAYRSRAFRKEMSKWINSNFSSKKEGLHGYSLRMPALLSLFISNVIRHFDIGSLLSKKNVESVKSASMICVITSDVNTKSNWIDIGRSLQRMLLTVSKYNLKSSIFAAAIEMGDLSGELKDVLETNHEPQILFCVGSMYNVRMSSRHNIVAKLV